ncbi:MAG: glycerophosphodiester phosphodiesterase family protein [Gammaproteobacteria bacterium]|nr:glycerophosphodiester phosphodiesterase family protein [Gammaproteobacteria bacterium]
MSDSRNHPFLQKPFSVIGHRGAAGHAPENSLEAFEIAFTCGVDAIEFDVKYVHGELIVFHDDTVERLTTSNGSIDSFSREELSELRLRNGEQIPTLEQVWDIVPPSIGINIELKGANTGRPVAEFVRTHSHRYLISSFLVGELSQFKAIAKNVPTALLTRVHDMNVLGTAASLGVENIHVMDAVADPSYLLAMFNAGFTVYVFTVNDVARAFQLRELDVAAIFTDIPADLNPETLVDA